MGDVTPGLETARRLAAAVRALPEVREGHPPRALIVGGWVRDRLLARETPDVDVEVHGVLPEGLDELLVRLFPDRINAVGRSFGIFKIHLAPGLDVDVALPRRDSKAGPGHKGFTVTGDPFLGVREAARRRDFTVNAMAFDPLGDEILDPWDGREDLAGRTLRAVDPDLFPDDPLRVWRAVQLAARLEFSVEPETVALLRAMVARGDLAELSRERVTEELRKLLVEARRPSLGLALARTIGSVADRFPELEAMAGTPQEPEWHPEGDVWVHTLMVVDRAAEVARRPEWGFSDAERLHVVLGALCHDLGKPLTTAHAWKDGAERIVSPRHEVEGEAPARTLLGKLTFGEDAERATLAIVRHHYQPYALFRALERGEMDERAYVNAVRRLVKKVHPVPWRVLLASTEGDWRGRAFPGLDVDPYPAGERFARTVADHRLDAEPTKPLVLGRDVLALGLAPGPEIGRLVALVEDARDRGEIVTREEALDLLRALVEGRS